MLLMMEGGANYIVSHLRQVCTRISILACMYIPAAGVFHTACSYTCRLYIQIKAR